MKGWIGWAALAGTAALAASSPADRAEPARPPAARKIVKVDELYGDKREDDYYWLREKNNPEVVSYLKGENAYTDAVMKPTETLQDALYKEMLGRIQETDLSVPYRMGRFLYYSRTEQGKAYPIYCRKKESLEAPEEILLDVNALARGESFMAVGDREISDDGNLLAYTTDNTGFREYRLRIKDLQHDALLPETVEK
ncbi:MAG TPA: oligopeptidase B, partial [Thermoanaerobaculia bacterium]|nr:oligopeptidase B [Thermoanaerobaculia bacterium]